MNDYIENMIDTYYYDDEPEWPEDDDWPDENE